MTTRILAAAFAALLARDLSAQETRPYEPVYRAWAEAGVMFAQSTELHSFPGAAGASKLTLHPGFRAGLGSGYEFTPYFSLDWELAVLAASVDKASGLQEMDATITQVPFLVNAAFQYQNETGFTPFVGIGVGVSSTTITVDEARSSTTRVDGSDYDFVFAWQATGGVKYEFKRRLALGVVYKYLWTADARWELSNDLSAGSGNQKLDIDGIRSHAILGFVSYRF
jgi:opacity protein-like surface antigen